MFTCGTRLGRMEYGSAYSYKLNLIAYNLNTE